MRRSWLFKVRCNLSYFLCECNNLLIDRRKAAHTHTHTLMLSHWYTLPRGWTEDTQAQSAHTVCSAYYLVCAQTAAPWIWLLTCWVGLNELLLSLSSCCRTRLFLWFNVENKNSTAISKICERFHIKCIAGVWMSAETLHTLFVLFSVLIIQMHRCRIIFVKVLFHFCITVSLQFEKSFQETSCRLSGI